MDHSLSLPKCGCVDVPLINPKCSLLNKLLPIKYSVKLFLTIASNIL
jgi:hypothetical protein